MAHELAFVKGKASIAYLGNDTPWHGLGQSLTKNAPIETWVKESGLDYPIIGVPVKFDVPVIDTKTTMEQLGITDPKKCPQKITKQFEGRQVLYRGDTGDQLSIVGENYKIVQPSQILEFFRDLVSEDGMYLETAGALFKGTRYWAMAHTNKEDTVVGNDLVKCRLLLTTSCDGTLATTGKFVAERVVCNNTLKIALGEKADSKSQIKMTHAGTFDSNKLKAALGLMGDQWEDFMGNLKKMSKTKVTDLAVKKFISDIMLNEEQIEALKKEEELHKRVQSKLDTIFDMYKGAGMGADMVTGTLWGALNAVTEYADHNIGNNADNKVWNSWFGYSEGLKNKAHELALEMI